MIDTEDQGAEAALLGAVLLARGAMDHALARVSAADFVRREHAAVYAACSRLISRGAPCEVRTVRSELAEMRAELPDAGALLLSLVDASADKRNAEHYAARVLELGMRRRLAEVSGWRTIERSRGALEAIAALRQQLDAIEQGRADRGAATGEDLAADARRRYEDARSGGGPSGRGIQTGFQTLDLWLGGLRPSKLYVLAARPGVGKTALAVNVLSRPLARGARAIFFSLEMSRDAIADRIITSESGLERDRIERAQLDEDDEATFLKALGALARSDIHVDDRSALPIAEVTSTAKWLHAKKAVDVVVVDYLQLACGSAQRRRDSREQEVSEVARGLKALAKDLRCPVLALAQLNRELERREDKTPRLSDLRESGEIEQTADAILMLHRAAAFDDKAPRGEAELFVRKNREGRLGAIPLRWREEIVRYEEADR